MVPIGSRFTGEIISETLDRKYNIYLIKDSPVPPADLIGGSTKVLLTVGVASAIIIVA